MFPQFSRGIQRTRRFSAAAITTSLLVATGGAVAAKDIVVAQIAPQTGVQASSGKAYTAGLRLGFDSINAAGGVNGSLIRLVTLDDGYKPDETVRLAKEVIAKENPVALAATVGTANAEALIKSGILSDTGLSLVGRVRERRASLVSPEST